MSGLRRSPTRSCGNRSTRLEGSATSSHPTRSTTSTSRPGSRLYPGATAWASPGVRERAASQNIEVEFDSDLGDEPEPAWRENLDQLIFHGSRFMEEVVFFHHPSQNGNHGGHDRELRAGESRALLRRTCPARGCHRSEWKGSDRPPVYFSRSQGRGPLLPRQDALLGAGEGNNGPRTTLPPRWHQWSFVARFAG